MQGSCRSQWQPFQLWATGYRFFTLLFFLELCWTDFSHPFRWLVAREKACGRKRDNLAPTGSLSKGKEENGKARQEEEGRNVWMPVR